MLHCGLHEIFIPLLHSAKIPLLYEGTCWKVCDGTIQSWEGVEKRLDLSFKSFVLCQFCYITKTIVYMHPAK